MVDASIATGTAGGDKVLRLREGIERFLITDINNPAASNKAQSIIPVQWDTFGNPSESAATAGIASFNHVPGGCNVAYMDGHVEFIRFPTQFPVLNDAGIMREVGHFGLY
jgi:prepilin-type processing-associated H-X9-DG protein